ncbi:MAG: TVP38/TMEM64 family protein [Alphaproteobacteria bacterium]|nr:TVP38/TMEM64 family protein [Alphaproteobacteria bacterium]
MVIKKKIGKAFWIILTVIPIIGIVIGIADPKQFEGWREFAQKHTEVFGSFAPIAFIAIQALQVIVTPISHYTVSMIGGFLFGPHLGGLFNWIGRLIGHTTAFWISRRFGRPIAKRFVEEKTFEKFDRIISGDNDAKMQTFILFLIYFLPLFPDDEISYIVGLSRMQKKLFLIANVFGHIGGSFALAYVGSGDVRDPIFWALVTLGIIGFPIIWITIRIKEKRC